MKKMSVMAMVLLLVVVIVFVTSAFKNQDAETTVAVGSYITFGAYEQDNDNTNGKEPIEWMVLAQENNRILVISRYVLEYKPYNETKQRVTWKTCTLRTWLNNDFLDAAFSREEQEAIPIVEVSTEKNREYGTNPGKATQDNVFLLSIAEVNRYFDTNSLCLCGATAYADDQGPGIFMDDDGWREWWLRSPGYNHYKTACVAAGYHSDIVDDFGNDNLDDCGVRPALWIDLDFYPDGFSCQRIESAQVEMLAQIDKGRYVSFGSYEQDNDTTNGNEPIEWLVLAKENNRILVISRYALDIKPYNEKEENVTWETCTLRTWLNTDFFNSAFSNEEQAMIPTVTVSADKNPSYSTGSGEATQDKVFLLSIAEAEKYFRTDSELQCKCTAYVKSQDAVTYEGGFASWWLRSPGSNQAKAASIHPFNGVDDRGHSVVPFSGGIEVRPAMWIDLARSPDSIEYQESETTIELTTPSVNETTKKQSEKNAPIAIGDYITFGSYEQDNDTTNGKELIEWLVLGKRNNCMLVISRYALDAKPYNINREEVTWETCTLRTWLNNDFINTAFSSTEQALIPTVTVSPGDNYSYSYRTDPGKETQDKVFLLSINEVGRYFDERVSRRCKATAYAVAQGADADSGGLAWWWLRSPGENQCNAAFVANMTYDVGIDVNFGICTVRPAMWIDLELYTNNLRVHESEANKGATGTSDIVNADVQGEP